MGVCVQWLLYAGRLLYAGSLLAIVNREEVVRQKPEEVHTTTMVCNHGGVS